MGRESAEEAARKLIVDRSALLTEVRVIVDRLVAIVEVLEADLKEDGHDEPA